jgi:hypothetical protein
MFVRGRFTNVARLQASVSNRQTKQLKDRKRRRLLLELLEDRTLLSVQFSPGPYVVPTNLTDVARGTLGTGCFPIEPFITVNPTNPSNIIISHQNAIEMSTDGGATLVPGTPETFNVASNGRCGDTGTVFDSQGRLFWGNLTDDVTPNQLRVYVRQVNPLTGAFIGGAHLVSATPVGDSDDKDFIAAGVHNDNLYVTWTRFTSTSTIIELSMSSDQGAHWSTPVTVGSGLNSGGDEGFTWPAMVTVGPDDTVYVSYHATPGNDDRNGEVFVAAYTPDLSTQIFKTQPFPEGTARLRGVNNANYPNSPYASTQGSGESYVLADPTRPGTLYDIATDDPSNGGAGNPANVMLAKSTDGGVTWTRSLIDQGPNANIYDNFPNASIDGGGVLFVSWYQTTGNTVNTGGNTHFTLNTMAKYSNDGGLSFSPTIQVNDAVYDTTGTAARNPDYIGSTIFGGTAYVTWGGNSTGTNQQVFTDAIAINGRVTINGDTGGGPVNDNFTFRQIAGNPGFIEVLDNGTTVYSGLLAGISQGIQFNGLTGDDSLTVDFSNGNPIPDGGLDFDGGTGFNSMTLTGGTETAESYLPGLSPGSGSISITVAGTQSNIHFENLSPIHDMTAGPLEVDGTPASNAINYTQGTDTTNTPNTAWGQVSVDNFEPINFTNKTDLTINSQPGGDTIDLNNPNVPAGLTGTISVNGNGTATLIANSEGLNLVLEPTGQGAGTVTYFGGGLPNSPFTGIASLQFVDTSTNPFGIDGTTGNDQFIYTPGATPDTGTVNGIMNSGAAQFPLVPVTFSNIQQAGVVVFNAFGQQGGTDSFVYNGVSGNDAIAVTNGDGGTGFGGITLSDTVNGTLFANLNLANMSGVAVQDNTGNNTFSHDGNVPIPVTYVGSGLAGGDTLNFNGNGSAVTATFSATASTVTDGAGTVTLDGGISILNINAGAGALTIDGAAGTDNFTYAPTDIAAGTVTDSAAAPIINFTNVSGTFTLDGGTGSNSVTVDGTPANDTITVAPSGTNTTVQVNGLQTVTLPNADTQALVIAGGLGNDNLVVDSTSGPVLIPVTDQGGGGSDQLTLMGGTATADLYQPGPNPGSGTSTLTFAAGTQVVHFIQLQPVVDVVSSPLVVDGTNADNAINYIQGPDFRLPESVLTTGLVSIDNQETIDFANKPNVTINGLAGSDSINLNNPTVPTGLTGTISVDGGDPTGGSDTLIVNSEGENLVLEPTGLGAGTVTYFQLGLPNTPFTNIEHLVLVDTATNPFGIDGTAGNDQFIYTPGATPDTGTVNGIMNDGIAQFPLVPVTFVGMQQAGVVVFNAFGQQGGTDSFVFNGTAGNDNIAVTNGSFTGFGGITLSDTVNGTLFANLNLVNMMGGLTVQDNTGNNTFTHDGNVPIPVTYVGSGLPGGDSLDFNGNGSPVTATFSATASTVTDGAGTVTLGGGIDVLNVNAGAATLTVNGTAGPDNFAYTPTDTAAGTVTDSVAAPTINFTNVTGTFTLDGGTGVNTVTVNGTSGDDGINVQSDGTNSTVQVNGLQAVTLPEVDTQALVLAGGLGNDTFRVLSATAAVTIPINVEGGPGNDQIILSGGTATDDVYTPGPIPGTGTSVLTFAAGTETVNFANIRPVIDLVTSPALEVDGTNASNAINYIQGPNSGTDPVSGVTTALVSIDDQETIEFSAKTTLTINGLAGSDEFNLNDPTTPDGLTGINVDGSDPTASDTLIVNGISGAPDSINFTPTAADAGTITGAGPVPITATTIEHLTINGNGNDADTLTETLPAGGNLITYTPGVDATQGSVAARMFAGASLLPMNYVNFGVNDTLQFVNASGMRADQLDFNGTAANDLFQVSTAGDVQIVEPVTGMPFRTLDVGTPGIAVLHLIGGGGNDTFQIPGNHPFPGLLGGEGINIEGGTTFSSNEIDFTGSGGAVTESLQAPQSIAEAGFAPVVFSAINTLNADVGAAALTINGTSGPDSLAYTPTGASAGTVTNAGMSLVTNFTNVAGTFTIDGGGGSNQVTVIGSNTADVANVVKGPSTTVQVNGFQTVTLPSTTVQNVTVATLDGPDTINVSGTTANNQVLTVNGGFPEAGQTGVGDTLNITSLTPGTTTVLHNTITNNGEVETPDGNMGFLSVENINLMVNGGPGGGGVTIAGTSEDDQFTVQNNMIQLSDQATVTLVTAIPTLTLLGFGGNDRFTVAPATMTLVTTAIVVDGDDPTTTATDFDTLQVNGTAAADTFNYAPTGPDAGSVQLNTAPTPVVTFTHIESATIDGQGGNDALTYTSPANVGGSSLTFMPGTTTDAGTITGARAGSPLSALAPLTFDNLGSSGTVAFASLNTARSDTLAVDGTGNSDIFNVAGGIGTVLVTGLTLPITTPAITNLRLNGLGGNDTFNLTGALPFANTVIDGDAIVDLTGAVAPVVINLADNTVPTNTTITGYGGVVTLASDVTVLNANATGQTLTANGYSGPNSFDYTPTGTAAGTFTDAGVDTTFNFTNVSGAFTINGNSNTGIVNTVTVHGTQGSDLIGVVKGANTTVQVNALQTVTLPSTTVQNVTVASADGTDTILVSGTTANGQILSVDGGLPEAGGSGVGDTLAVTTLTPGTTTIVPGSLNNNGVVETPDGLIGFVSIENIHFTGNGAGPGAPGSNLTVQGSNEDDQFTVENNTVAVSDLPTVTISGVGVLLLQGLGGSDSFSVSPATMTTVASITVEGDEPTASDTLVVNGTAAADMINYAPTGPDVGSVTVNAAPVVNFNTIEHVTINGLGGNDALTYTSPMILFGSVLTFTPGANIDAGTVTGSTRVSAGGPLTPLSFQNLGNNGNVTFASANAGRSDKLILNGTVNADQFNLNGLSDTVEVAGTTLVVSTPAITDLRLQGIAGNDTFNLVGALPYGSTVVDADSIVNLSGATGLVTVNLADPALALNTTIMGYGGIVTLIDVATANLDTTMFGLTVNGTSQPDRIVYTPTAPDGGTVVNNGISPTINFTSTAGTFTINGNNGGGIGMDQVQIDGSVSRDLFQLRADNRTASVTDASGTLLKTVVLGADVQVLTGVGESGQDTFAVTQAPGIQFAPANLDNLLITVDGGNGAFGTGENNSLVVWNNGATLDATHFVVVNKGADGTSGTVRVFNMAIQQPDIDYTNIQVVSPRVSTPNGSLNPNLLIMGPDLNEPNEFLGNATFLGSAGTIQVQHASIFPNGAEFPGGVFPSLIAPDIDSYRLVAQSTGTLDMEVFFRVFAPGLLPGDGRLDVRAFDVAGNQIGDAYTGPFGVHGMGPQVGNDARIRIPVVAGQTYYLQVFGVDATGAPNATVVNGYDMNIIDTPPPVPHDLELSRSLPNGEPGNPAGTPDTGDLPANSPADDTGRSQFDNVTHINNPRIYVRVDDAGLLQDLPGNQTPDSPPAGVIPIPFDASTAIGSTTPGFRVDVFDGGNGAPAAGVAHMLDPNDPTFIGFAQQVPGFPHLYFLDIGSQGADSLADGEHLITARVQILDPAANTARGFGDRSTALDIIVDTVPPPVNFGSAANGFNGLDSASDSGVIGDTGSFSDRDTNVTTPSFFGQAEANAIVRVYAIPGVGAFNPATAVFLGETVAIPTDGTNAFPNGMWSFRTPIDLNNPLFFPQDGTRTIFVTAEDLAGNVSAVTSMRIFIDTQGPQVNNVFITGHPLFDLFGLKPANAGGPPTGGPTPLVNSLTITIQDNPNFDPNFPSRVRAIEAAIASTPDNIMLKGDFVGNIAIQSVVAVNNAPVPGVPLSATITVTFFAPLPDDRYTLTILDTGVVDPAGNKLDGESNAREPLNQFGTNPHFPSGDGVPGGDFVARFTVDSRPHIGTTCCSAQALDINGNGVFDPAPLDNDIVNRDLVFHFGQTTDAIFSGNFSPTAMAPSTGFSKLGAYGQVNGLFRWLLNFDSTGVPNFEVTSGLQLDARPVAFDFFHKGADQIGLFDGQGNWFIDSNFDNNIEPGDLHINDGLTGFPIVGDFDGNGQFDLGTYRPDLQTFFFDLNPLGSPHTFQQIHIVQGGDLVGFPGVNAIPVAADMDQDGVTDIGLFVPNRQAATPSDTAEWFFYVSNDPAGAKRIAGQVNTLNHHFSPAPLGNDVFFKFGGNPAFPVVGLWDAPETPANFDPSTVERAYQFFLGRPLTSGELAGWNSALTSGTSYSQFLADVVSSPEYVNAHGGTAAGFVSGLYHDVLGRAPSAAEQGNWVANINAGLPESTVAYDIITSAEATNAVASLNDWQSRFHFETKAWVGALYHDTLGRYGSAAELVPWEQALDQGAESRADVVNTLMHSTEHYTHVINGYYETYLGRAVDQGGLAAWLNLLQNGGSLDQVLEAIVSSPEYFARHGGTLVGYVGALFGDVLGRHGSQTEVAAWANSGLSQAAIADAFLHSAEHLNNILDAAYQTYLHRPIDVPSLAGWEAFLGAGGSYEDVLDSIFGSQEYFQLNR